MEVHNVNKMYIVTYSCTIYGETLIKQMLGNFFERWNPQTLSYVQLRYLLHLWCLLAKHIHMHISQLSGVQIWCSFVLLKCINNSTFHLICSVFFAGSLKTEVALFSCWEEGNEDVFMTMCFNEHVMGNHWKVLLLL